ncbi:hypothetical protein FHS83_001792 [Rhizomicrobium palustre]|uniref:Polysaccharide biosynthesis protein n=1 Tax=Rhizomicrobium palustre TaxID=189966 RepID=A0A846MXZ0_9PROT|nr:hypothetical protein [Rhizomicrobium palustre]NIK88474.1 hypothetical protein [Rhizomicrobium palustre]
MSSLGLADGSSAVLKSAYRYAVSAAGPVAISGAHFLASLCFLRLLAPADFGHFSFLLIVVPFCLSLTGAALGAPASMTRGRDAVTARAELLTLQKASLIVSLLAGIGVTAMMALTGAHFETALLFGLYGAGTTLRCFARSHANVLARIERAAGSDLAYSLVLVMGLGLLAATGRFSLDTAAMMMVAATAVSLLPFGQDYAASLAASRNAPLKTYLPMWQAVTRWSLLGVALTEVAVNCHAYLVTFLSGPGAFGLLALGALFMRPASLVLGALPDIDQPLMTKKLAAGDVKGAFRVVNEFRTAAGAVLAGTVVLAVVLVVFFPTLLLKHYAVNDVWVVLAFWTAITALRALRTPEAVFVMATGGYSKLAWISAVSGAVALAATLALLLSAGPLYALGGIALGEVVMLAMLLPLNKPWRARRG